MTIKHTWISLIAVATLGGCATQNQFAGASTQYNLQTEQAQDRALLLNVLRASRRRPLVFFDLQTVQGVSPASGALGFSLPLAQNGTPVHRRRPRSARRSRCPVAPR
ncbi:MAG: hypothetical protein ACR2F8_00690 [Caulobacteraceae bacterium]